MIKSGNTTTAIQDVIVIYDGECPFCSRYVELVRLQKAAGQVLLLDARSKHELVQYVAQRGYDLNQGMVMLYGDQIFYGNECLHKIALLSTQSDLFNRVNAALFRHPKLAKFCYPLLRSCRNLILKVLRKPPIEI